MFIITRQMLIITGQRRVSDGYGKCYSNGISRDQYNYDTETGKISRYHHLEWYEILIALGVAAVCGGTAVASVLRSYGPSRGR